MGLRGGLLKDEIFFEPGLERTYSYHFATNAGFTQDYEGYVRMHDSAVDLTPYVELSQYYWEDVPTGAQMSFSATLKLPDRLDTPGIYEIRPGITETQNKGGGAMGVRTAAEGRIIIIVLHPDNFIEAEFSAPNANVNSSTKFTFFVRNLGEPDVNIRGKVDIISVDSPMILGVTNTETVLVPSTHEQYIRAPFNTTGLKPGSYKALATLFWGNNISRFNKTFHVGTKNVVLKEYTKDFRTDAINKMMVTVESGWNDKFKNVYANVRVFDEIGQVKKEFRTVSTALNPWNSNIIEGYFDTAGFSPGIYDASIAISFDDGSNFHDVQFNISETAKSIVVDAIPEDTIKEDNIWITILLVAVVVLLLAVAGLLILMLKRR
ncbi:MAG: hypothetical protein KKG59_02530 [Nanoarchaeota archaeon]|nr:hypothetical protein [Nanoarchaeota archaeon]